MNIHILAASDRNNYGDLLFPLVVTRYLNSISKAPLVINNYGIVKSDLSDFGAIPTLSFDDLIQHLRTSKSEELIIIAGGEVLGSNWLNIYRFLSPLASRIHKNQFLRRVLNRFDLLSKYFSTLKGSSYPFILDGSPFNKGVKIVYNAVGGNIGRFLNKDSRLLEYFKSIEWLSIRDVKTKKAFDERSIPNSLVPDSALLMSDFFEDLDAKISPSVREIISTDYVYVQLGNTKGPNDLQKFSLELEQFAESNRLQIVLSPIGLALDHDDLIILRQLNRLCKNSILVMPENLFDTMCLLKGAKIYIGTSLHGVITSQSFNIPFVAFTEKIRKLDIYIKTWFDNAENISLNFEQFQKVYEVYSTFDSTRAQKVLDAQKQLIYSNFQTMFKDV